MVANSAAFHRVSRAMRAGHPRSGAIAWRAESGSDETWFVFSTETTSPYPPSPSINFPIASRYFVKALRPLAVIRARVSGLRPRKLFSMVM